MKGNGTQAPAGANGRQQVRYTRSRPQGRRPTPWDPPLDQTPPRPELPEVLEQSDVWEREDPALPRPRRDPGQAATAAPAREQAGPDVPAGAWTGCPGGCGLALDREALGQLHRWLWPRGTQHGRDARENRCDQESL